MPSFKKFYSAVMKLYQLFALHFFANGLYAFLKVGNFIAYRASVSSKRFQQIRRRLQYIRNQTKTIDWPIYFQTHYSRQARRSVSFNWIIEILSAHLNRPRNDPYESNSFRQLKLFIYSMTLKTPHPKICYILVIPCFGLLNMIGSY